MDTSAGKAVERLRAATRDGRLADVCERHGVAVLTVFGSAGRGEATPRSDLDVALAFVPGSQGNVLALWDDLYDLVAPIELDLLDLGKASIVARAHALLGEPLYEDEAGRYVAMRDAAVLEKLDTAWLRRLNLELMAG